MAIKQIIATLPFQDPSGAVLASGSLTLDLSQPASATGSGEVAPLRVTVALNSSGTFSATNLWANDQLAPNGTTYRLRAYNNNGLLAGDWGAVSIQGSSPIDVSLLVPVSTGGGTVFLPSGVLLLNAQINAAPITGNSAPQTVYTYTVPASLVANTKAFRLTFGLNHSTGVASVQYILTLNAVTIFTVSTASTASSAVQVTIQNTGATTASATILSSGGLPLQGSSAAYTGLAWSSSQVLQLTFNVAATDQVTPVQWLVELIQ